MENLKLLTYSPTEKIDFIFIKYTFEKEITNSPCYKMNVLRKAPAKIEVLVNYEQKTISVQGKEFKTEINREYTYKKTRGNVIQVSDFKGFVDFLKESNSVKNVFHNRTEALLLSLCKNNFTYLN